jgi:hypothetical protein
VCNAVEAQGAKLIVIDSLNGLVQAMPNEQSLNTQFLQQLFQNLISNALKYRRESEAPRVHISAARHGPVWRFSVADNGIGIAPEYHENVFGVFNLSVCTATTGGTPEPVSDWPSARRSSSATAGVSGSNRSMRPEAPSTSPFPLHRSSI